MDQDIKITVIDRNGVSHVIDAPIDMAMNLMEVIRTYELATEGTIGTCGGMAMCASCQCYILSNHRLPEKQDDEEAMLSEAFPGYKAPVEPEQMGSFIKWFIPEGGMIFNGKVLPVSLSTP